VLPTPNVSNNAEKLDHSYITGRNIKILENSLFLNHTNTNNVALAHMDIYLEK
jgi:hypothetical protein